jgi:hypothetical protein
MSERAMSPVGIYRSFTFSSDVSFSKLTREDGSTLRFSKPR